jgi:hypothetical protein
MSKLRYINTKLWRDPYIRKQDPHSKLLWVYLLTNENVNIAGCYEITVDDIALETRLDRAEIAKILRNFALKKRITYKNEWMLIHNFLEHEPLNPKKTRGIEILAEKFPQWAKAYVIDRLSLACARAESDLNPREEEEEREPSKNSPPTPSRSSRNPAPSGAKVITSEEVKRLTKQLGDAKGFAEMWATAFPDLQAPPATLALLEAKGYRENDLADDQALTQTFLRYRDRFDPVRGSYDPRKASTFASVWLEERGKISKGAPNGTGTNGAGGNFGRTKPTPAEVITDRPWRTAGSGS